MKLGSREWLTAAICGVVGLLGFAGAVVGEYHVAVASIVVLLVIVIIQQLLVLRRVLLRQQGLDRLEHKLDTVARRVITESEALAEEIRRAT